MKNKIKSTKGITLIALIITIIVVIILAGISVNLLVGENGIITRAKDAAVEQAVGQRKEAVSLALTTEYAKQEGDTSKMTVEGVLSELRTSLNSNEIYAKKGSTTIDQTTGETELDGTVSFYFPAEINGAANREIIVAVDGNLNVSGTSTSEVANVVVNYTITYDKNDANATGTMSPTTGVAPQVASNGFTAPEEKQFKEWNTSANGQGTTVAAGTTVNQNTTLYAIWENIPVSTEWEIVTDNGTTGLSVGDLVRPTVTGLTSEQFYVINIGNEADPVVTLLAQYCVDWETANAQDSTMGVYDENTGEITGALAYDQGESNDYSTSNIKTYVDLYAGKFTGMTLQEARLMLYSEYFNFYADQELYCEIMWSSDYWLGTSDGDEDDGEVYTVAGSGQEANWCGVEYDNYFGLRPVFEILSSKISTN